ncbi:MAG: alanine--tRNA ligase [Candidatus Omnitrophota bacterium]
MQADILRKKFLDFFKSKNHKIIESGSLIPGDDPTVLFTPAGMNQFKKEFLGIGRGLKRASSSQRCLRTDDLDKVGKTSGHHTFFEMLGNFSFGDYFKKEAILYAWEFLARELRIPSEKLWVSVYKDDDETYKIWRDSIEIPENKIIRLGDKENFWPSEAKAKGPNGPCGPCSEIFYDVGSGAGCGKPDCSPACGCGRFVEVWNLVFTQFNRKEGGVLEPLPRKNIDTGMGLERLAAVMQGVANNFETDLFIPIIKEIARNQKPVLRLRSGLALSRVEVPGTRNQKELIYAVTDHIRAIVFAIYDGVLPSNEARGYVIRKLIRKCTLHLRAMGWAHAFLYKLVPVVAETMKSYYPELRGRQENISEIIQAEEKSFLATLNSSEALLHEKFKGFQDSPNPKEVGRITFQLYDTHGMPLDLTLNWLEKKGIQISKDILEKELSEQKKRSKLQSAMKGDVFSDKDLLYHVKATQFSGYKEMALKTKILKIVKGDTETKKISQQDEAVLVLDKTPFYAESGGQVGDAGEIIKGRNVFEVFDTKRFGSCFVHIGKVKSGSFKKNDTILAKADVERRLSIARNHTATHLLQAALRKVLGSHVKQRGSLVAHDRLRFDFTHFKDIKKEELDRIEEVVNDYILNNHQLSVKPMALAQAKKSGALAFFGEKYEDKVRVVSVGDFSKELCGGTHLDSTGSIGLFKITQEGSVASGIRRIEAVTGKTAYKIIKEEERVVRDIAERLSVPEPNLSQEIEKRMVRLKELEKQLSAQRLNTVRLSLEESIQKAELINGIKLIEQNEPDLDMNTLRQSVDLAKEKTTNAIIISSTCAEAKIWLAIGVTQDLCAKGVDASRLIKEVASEIGGSGGGRKDFAQAGGSKPQNYKNALEKLKAAIRQIPR